MTKEKRLQWLKKYNGTSVSPLACEPKSVFPETDDHMLLTASQQKQIKVSSISQPDQVVIPASSSQPQQAMRLSEKLSVLSTPLGLPVKAIDGIAKKAAEILCTEDGMV